MRDNRGRTIDYLRISLTDRCNLRCIYCMPLEGVESISHDDILSYEEILKIARACVSLGVKKIRLTGGEPLVRKNVTALIRDLKAIEGLEEVSITTNGVLLYDMIESLVQAGLDRVNLSLDSLKGERFRSITRTAELDHVLKGMEKSIQLGVKVRINAVLIKGINEDEAIDFVEMINRYPVDVRFIELMPIGRGSEYEGVNNKDLIDHIKNQGFELKEVEHKAGSGPARYFELEGAQGDLGFISPMSHQFCDTCNRVRLTSEGFLKLCLHSGHGLDLRAYVRKGASENELIEAIEAAIASKPSAHAFEDISAEKDKRSMNQIGG